ncbi:MAG: acetolactate synthase [Euryarchaeota archaeon]|nr:acetolactate synthase [Euryarchaeota archaeon]
MYEKYKIKQLSIFSENRPGRLAAMARAMMDEGINIYAFTIAEGAGYGVIRALVDQPERAFQKLSSMGVTVRYTDVLAVEMKDHPGGLYDAVSALAEEGINIEYSYAYSGKRCAVLFMRVEDSDVAAEKLLAKDVKLLELSQFT